MGPKIQFLKKVFPATFFTHKTCFATFHLKPKNQKIFRPHFSKNFTSDCPPMEPKFQFLKKVFPTPFFTHKTCFTKFHND